MGKQILKGFTMLMLVVGLAFVSAVVSANGQATGQVTADLPFQFVVGDKSLPAGKYVAKSNTGSRVVAIENRASHGSAMRITSDISGNGKSEKARLIFHRYGNRYFLAEVWMGERNGSQLTKSREEKALERELASLASKGGSERQTFELIAIAASPR
jgi:hypothetical protein